MSTAVHNFGLTRDLQEELRELLQEDEALFAPPRTLVIAQNKGDIESQIEEAVGTMNTGGGVIVIGAPEPIQNDPRKPWMFGVNIPIYCKETSIVNRSTTGNDVHGERLAEIVNNLLTNYLPESNGWCELRRTTWETGQNDQGDLVDVVTFTTETVYDTQAID